MPNSKISALTIGGPAQSADLIPIARSGANYSLTGAQIAALAALTRYSNFASPVTLVQVGSSAVWTLSATFTISAMVFWNGQLLSPVIDYTTSGSSITFLNPPVSTDALVVMQ